MLTFKSDVARIKYEVFREVARLTLAGELAAKVDGLPRTFTDSGFTGYRCCVYKERAVLAERIKLTLGFSPRETEPEERLSEIVARRLSEHRLTAPVISIIETACDHCPIDRYMVTDACRGCVAHFCVNACPKKAIRVFGGHAYIDQDQCVECGRCSQACHFHAIVEVIRPCERSCPVGAIKPGPNRNSVIDFALCTACGICITACPFGAISDKSQLVEVISWLKAGQQVVAAFAPAIAGQFGPNVSLNQVMATLQKVGFSAAVEVASGADQVAKEEAREFRERIAEKGWLASSCCPAFVSLIKKHYPDLIDHISLTPSPMVTLARRLKEVNPDCRVVFIGPCVAKKEEALTPGSGVDAVLTFAELAAFLDASGLDPAKETPPETPGQGASPWGRGFAVSGGVAAAIQQELTAQGADVQFNAVRANGLEECKRYLNLARAGKLPGNFLEGMACVGGCVGGPAALVDAAQGGRAVEKFRLA